MGNNLDAHFFHVLFHHKGITLDVVVTNHVNRVWASNLWFKGSYLVCHPPHVKHVVTFGLTYTSKTWTLNGEDVYISKFFFYFFDYRLDIIANQCCRAGGVDHHPLDVRKFCKRFQHRFFQQFFTTEDNMLFLHV